MAQPQRPADAHQEELCPPNKRYALMDANKKVDVESSLCPDESKILADILKNHPLRFSIAPILTTDETDDLILQDTLQVSLAEQKGYEELEATQNVEKIKEHFMAEEIEKLVKGMALNKDKSRFVVDSLELGKDDDGVEDEGCGSDSV
nr:hypothetical protein [Tanacetum cinerariifolium]